MGVTRFIKKTGLNNTYGKIQKSMGLFKRFMGLESVDGISRNPILGYLNFGTSSSSYSKSKALKISTVYRAVNIISDSIAKLEICNYDFVGDFRYKKYDDLYYLLNVQPNEVMGGFTFKKAIVVYMLLKGNTYIYVDRDNDNNIKSLKLLNPDLMVITVKDDSLVYTYNKKQIDSDDIIHIANFSGDNFGIVGESVLGFAANSLGLAYDSDNHARNFFKGGASMAGILRPKDGVMLKTGEASKAKQRMQESLNPDLGNNSAGIVVLDSGLEFQTVSISPKDSQLLETRTFNISDIARWFGVPLAMLFAGDNKYNTQEGAMLDFLANCLQPIIERIENELFRKLFLRSEWEKVDLLFDTSNLYRLDAASQADYYTKMFNVGAYTSNDIRQKINNVPITGGNRAFVQVNLQPIDKLNADKEEPIK